MALGMYTVARLAGSSKIATGPGPDYGTIAGVCPQPALVSALQVAPLNTATVLSFESATYSVSGLLVDHDRARISVPRIAADRVGDRPRPLHRETDHPGHGSGARRSPRRCCRHRGPRPR